ncbi:MAG: WecB/TagA/CpsF family glycosyltransferase [Syntrophomonadales bacterium]
MRLEQTEVLGCRLDIVDMPKALQVIEDAIQKRELSQVITLNAEMIYRAQHNQQLRDIYSQARLVTPDGIGVVWALRRAGWEISRRVTGVGLTLEILGLAREKNWRIFLLGAEPGVAQEVARKLAAAEDSLEIAGVHHGYFADEESPTIIDLIRAARPDILLVGLGAPRQDIWIAQHLDELQVPVCIGVGGTFDVLAGKVRRAPRIWRRLGLEWLYRLISEPKRIKRQLALPRFAWLVLRQGQKGKRRG